MPLLIVIVLSVRRNLIMGCTLVDDAESIVCFRKQKTKCRTSSAFINQRPTGMFGQPNNRYLYVSIHYLFRWKLCDRELLNRSQQNFQTNFLLLTMFFAKKLNVLVIDFCPATICYPTPPVGGRSARRCRSRCVGMYYTPT